MCVHILCVCVCYSYNYNYCVYDELHEYSMCYSVYKLHITRSVFQMRVYISYAVA